MPVFSENPGLFDSFREGRSEALSRVYRTYVRRVERYVHALSRASSAREMLESGVIEDLLQEIFVRAFAPNARENFDAARPYFPYLKAIARNCFVDMLRARGREVLKAPGELDLDVEGEDVDSDPVVDPRVRRVLTQYLGELSAPLEGVYRERFVLGRSQDDASNSLGLSRRQLRTAEEHLRSGLRRALQRAGVLRGEIELRPQQIIRPTPRRSPN